MFTYSILPAHFTDAKYHRRCGIHVQTLLLYHEPITILVAVAAISIGIVLLTYPNLHQKTSLYQQLFQHYARIKSNNYLFFYRTAVTLWIGVHVVHMITVATTILATHLIRPELLYPQLVMLVMSVGFYTFVLLSIITLNFIGSSLIWISALVATFFCFFTILIIQRAVSLFTVALICQLKSMEKKSLKLKLIKAQTLIMDKILFPSPEDQLSDDTNQPLSPGTDASICC